MTDTRYDITTEVYEPSVSDVLKLIEQGERLGFKPERTTLRVAVKVKGSDGVTVDRVTTPSALILRGDVPKPEDEESADD